MKRGMVCLCIIVCLFAGVACKSVEPAQATPAPTTNGGKYAAIDPENIIEDGIVGVSASELSNRYADLTREQNSDYIYTQSRACMYYNNEAAIVYTVDAESETVIAASYLVDTADLLTAYQLFMQVAEALETLGGETSYYIGGVTVPDGVEFSAQTALDYVYEYNEQPAVLWIDVLWKDAPLDIVVRAMKDGADTHLQVIIRRRDLVLD